MERPEHTAKNNPTENFNLYDETRVPPQLFHTLYEVGKKLEYNGRVHEGIRKSDGQKVFIKFVERQQRGEPSESPEFFSDEITTMLTLQKLPTCDHVIQFYDWFVMKDDDVLVMEYPHPSVTLAEFIKSKKGHLTEDMARRIMWQLADGLRHCWDRGVFFLSEGQLLINPDTLQLKINFSCEAKCLGEGVKLSHAPFFYFVMNALIKAIRRPFWKKTVSRECVRLLKRLRPKGKRPVYTLENISHDPWFAGMKENETCRKK
ncbi:serine/threonine-protein kinase pim-1-like [Pseudorasbora parva]|uniref:serine/threonine-protein kinase pim-1-like n=1 Tax=Pseudorasbora parva TaxID=51549 RepID=UPI00351F28AC